MAAIEWARNRALEQRQQKVAFRRLRPERPQRGEVSGLHRHDHVECLQQFPCDGDRLVTREVDPAAKRGINRILRGASRLRGMETCGLHPHRTVRSGSGEIGERRTLCERTATDVAMAHEQHRAYGVWNRRISDCGTPHPPENIAQVSLYGHRGTACKDRTYQGRGVGGARRSGRRGPFEGHAVDAVREYISQSGPLPPKVRIGFLEGNQDGTIGGSYFSLLFLVESLDRSRYDRVVIFRREHALIPQFRQVADAVHVIPPKAPIHLRIRPLRRIVNAGQFLLTVARQARFLRRERLHLLHLNNSITRNHDWMLAARIARIPCITHERGINPGLSRADVRAGSLLKAVICISEAVRQHLLGKGLAAAKLHVIHNGLDPARVVPMVSAAEFRSLHRIPAGAPVIAMVGNIKRWKGQEVLLRALPTLVQRFPRLVCLFVGDTAREDEAYERALRQMIASTGLEAHARFTGYCANVADALNVADVAIHASIAPEPFGRVLLEAMAMRKPVVASRGGAVPEIVVDGVSGRTFPPGNDRELAACVIDLLASPERARAVGEAGYNRVLARFHVRTNVWQTTALYEELLGLAAERSH